MRVFRGLLDANAYKVLCEITIYPHESFLQKCKLKGKTNSYFAILQNIPDQHPKYLLTLDWINKEANYDGIKKINVLNWLME